MILIRKNKEHENHRNDYGNKTLKTSFGEIDINVPKNSYASFDIEFIFKRKQDFLDIRDKVSRCMARGMSQLDIVATIEDIYRFYISHEMI